MNTGGKRHWIILLMAALVMLSLQLLIKDARAQEKPLNPNQEAVQKGEQRPPGSRGPLGIQAVNGSIIQNGMVRLGVNNRGELNYSGGSPSSGYGTSYVGLRYIPTNADALAPGCLCEGWGVADYITKTTGYANRASGTSGLTVESFESDGTSATSVVRVGSTFRVTHKYAPSPETDNLYTATVTIENTSGATTDVRYRRVLDWDIEPTYFNEYVTINTGRSNYVLYASDDGFASANPLASRTSILGIGDMTDSGPTDHGALFDFGLGALESGKSITFRIFYGAGPDQVVMLDALKKVDAEAYSLGKPSSGGGREIGAPNTFAFGFSSRESTVAPLIFVPGVAGSNLLDLQGNEKWPRGQEVYYNDQGDKFLLDISLDKNGNEVIPTESADIIRRIPVNVAPTKLFDDVDVYETTIKTLTDAGYEENKSLFVFPFDWRKDVENQGRKELIAKIKEVQPVKQEPLK